MDDVSDTAERHANGNFYYCVENVRCLVHHYLNNLVDRNRTSIWKHITSSYNLVVFTKIIY